MAAVTYLCQYTTIPSTDLHQMLIQTNIYAFTNVCGDITALQNRKQNLMWKPIFKTTGDEALLLDAYCNFLNDMLPLILKIGSEDKTAIAFQLKAEALKWMKKGKDKGKSCGSFKGCNGEKGNRAAGSIRSSERVVAYTSPEDDNDKEDEEEETS
ncbi:hypothetical protein C0995_011034 [Termitomyces sp. Mi166|nr:hypothetical protein C0995_011034 [Termitomyces sp. Mi166\